MNKVSGSPLSLRNGIDSVVYLPKSTTNERVPTQTGYAPSPVQSQSRLSQLLFEATSNVLVWKSLEPHQDDASLGARAWLERNLVQACDALGKSGLENGPHEELITRALAVLKDQRNCRDTLSTYRRQSIQV